MCAPTEDASDPERSLNQPHEADWAITNADWVVTADKTMRCIQSGTVVIKGDTIVAVGPSSDLGHAFKCRHHLDASGHIILPGLINTHTHAAMSCFRGLADDLPLSRWLHEVIFPAEAECVNPEMVYWGTMLSCVEMLLGGVTTFCDGYFYEQVAAQAALDSGIRAVLGQGILDFPTPDQADPKQFRVRAEAFLTSFPHDVSRLRPSLFCHSLYTCSPETLRWTKGLCREHELLFQIHVSETSSEVDDIISRYGKRPIHFMDHLNLLDDRTLCVHAVWLDNEEIKLLGLRHAAVSHNIESNMKLGSGIAPIQEMLYAGVKVGLGTDGCASNNNLDMFMEMDKVAKVHKVFRNNPVICPAHEVLSLATRVGAASIGLGNSIGSIEAGKQADIIAVDIRQPHLTPLYDPVSHLVYAAKSSDVRYAWVDGRVVVWDRRVQGSDVPEIMQKVNDIAAKLKSR